MKTKSSFAVLIFFIILGIGIALAYARFGVQANTKDIWIGVISFFIALIVSSAIKIADQWEKAAVLRLGRFHSLRGPGLFFIIPVIDTIPYWIDIRVITTSFTAEKTLTKDTVPVDVDAVLFWKVLDPKKAALDVADYKSAINWASQTALRDVIGKTMLSDMLEGRDKISNQLQKIIDERSEIEETGEYDLEGLFIRLGYAIDSIGAKRVVLDTIESLFAGLPNQLILRAELRRLFRWLKDKGVTAIITGERGEETLTRQGLEEYISDCVIMLDHRVTEQTSTRRLRVVKYRGSMHGTNEYPFLIDENGFSVLPVTSLGLKHIVSNERISTGITVLDKMLEGKGYYRGSTVLVSGTAGVGKTSIAAHFAEAACKRGERVLFFCFEESPNQLMRNMLSIGIKLETWVQKELLQFQATRPTFYGLEMHLAVTHKDVHAQYRQRIWPDKKPIRLT